MIKHRPGITTLPLSRLTALAAALLNAPCVMAGEETVTQTLPTITVTERGEPDASTAPGKSYAADAVTIGKTTTSLRETPQSVSVVTRQRLDDQNLNSLADAMQQTTGMTVTSYGTGTSNISSRGYELDTYQMDGLPVRAGQGTWTSDSLDLALYDRIEVLRGPAGILQGSGEPGGTINLVRKRASATPGVNASLSAGSWNRFRQDADVTGRLNASGSVRGRVVAAHESADSFVDVVDSERTLGYGTLEFDLDEQTTLSVGATLQKGNYTPFYGLPVEVEVDGSFNPAAAKPLPVRRSTFLGANWNTKEDETRSYFMELERHLDNGGQAKLAIRQTERDNFTKHRRANFPYIALLGNEIDTQAVQADNTDKDLGIDGFLSRPFSAFGRADHKLLAGVSFNRHEEASAYRYGVTDPIDIFNPVTDVPEPVFSAPDLGKAAQQEYGLYSQTLLRLRDRLTLSLGGRVSWWKATDKMDPTANQKVDNQFIPFAGLIYDINSSLTGYLSYSNIFKTQTERDYQNHFLDPREGNQYEMGLKGSFLNSALNTHLAVFYMEDINRAKEDLDPAHASGPNPTPYQAAGKVRSRGLEAEVSGRVVNGLDLSAGYAYNDAKEEGAAFNTEFPKHLLNVWSKYTIQSGALRNLSTGLGARAQSAYTVDVGGVPARQAGFVIAQAQIGYQITPHVSVSLTANNLFDKTYYARLSPYRQSYYGEPRNYMLTLRAAY